MTVLELRRAITPLGWLVSIVALVAVMVVFGRAAGLRWDPLDLAGRRAERAEAAADRAMAHAAARSLEAEGRAEQVQDVQHHYTLQLTAERAVARATTAAQGAPDANEPLHPDRVARLRAADRELCAAAAAVCAAAPDAP